MQTISLRSLAAPLGRIATVLAIGFVALVATQSGGCTSTPGQPDGGPICMQGGNTCAAGTACTNGVCVRTCGTSADGGTETACPAGFYCENTPLANNVCSPIQTVSCATDLDCPVPQACAAGICSSLELRGDGSTQGCLLTAAIDLCAPDSVCYQIPNTSHQVLNYCVGLSHCSEDGGCPVVASGVGAVCNQEADGGLLIANKERLCLYGFCTNVGNCPSGDACFHGQPGVDLGQCQQGFPGNPCYTALDCFNSTTGCEYPDGGFSDGGANTDGGILGTCF